MNAKNYFFLFCIIMSVGCKSEFDIFENSKATSSQVQMNRYMRGINIMDLGQGYGAGAIPGTFGVHYTKPTPAVFLHLKNRGHDVVRLPFLWERVQPVRGGALNPTYLGYIIEALTNANNVGLKVILDMHNGAGFFNGAKSIKMGEDGGPTMIEYADVWTKLSSAIKAAPDASAAIYAYDIMNEPNGIRDTRGSLPITGNTTIANFDLSDDGWAMTYNSGGETRDATYDSYNGGALKVVYTLPIGTYSYQNLGVQRLAIPGGINPSNGKTIRVTGFIPATLDGTFPQVRLTLRQGSFTQSIVGIVPVTKGRDFDIVFNPTDAQWVNVTGLNVTVVVNNVTGVGPYEYYLYKVQQGTAIVGQSNASLWEEYSQVAVDAIRANDDEHNIMIEGYGYASAKDWASTHPAKWINDPIDKIIYQAHSYFDYENSGTYTHSFAQETTYALSQGHTSVADRSVKRVKVFTDWVRDQGVVGFMGELGWPNSHVNPTDAADWNAVGEAIFTHLDSEKMGATMWCSGTWMAPTTNKLNVYSMNPFLPLSPSLVLENHLGKEF